MVGLSINEFTDVVGIIRTLFVCHITIEGIQFPLCLFHLISVYAKYSYSLL